MKELDDTIKMYINFAFWWCDNWVLVYKLASEINFFFNSSLMLSLSLTFSACEVFILSYLWEPAALGS